MKIGVYAGSFDPITKGHQDIIKRSLKIVDKLIVVVMNNSKKKYWFDLEERKKLINKVVKDNKNISVEGYSGLLVNFMKEKNSNILIKGVRDIKDFSEEMIYFYANKDLSNDEVETIFIPTSKEYNYTSSTLVKELVIYNQDLTKYVDESIMEDIIKKVNTVFGR